MQREYIVQLPATFEFTVAARSEEEAANLAAGFLEDGDFHLATFLSADEGGADVYLAEENEEEESE